MKHLINSEGVAYPCPTCYLSTKIGHKLREYGFPESFLNFKTEDSTLADLLNTIISDVAHRAHFVTSLEKRPTILAHLVCGWLLNDKKVTYVDSAKLSPDHYSKDRKSADTIFNVHGPIIMQIGHEVETKLGMFYLKGFLDRSVMWNLPFVLLTPQDTRTLTIKYPELDSLIKSSGFNTLNYQV